VTEKRNPVSIIAEIGNTHEGSVGLARQFIRTAAECGVDAVKLQTHIFDAESLPNAPSPPYFKDESRKQYFERTAFSLGQWRELKRCAEEECGVDFLSSPFSLEAVELLEAVGLSVYKIPSGEVTNLPLLERIAKTGGKVLLSSGMSSWAELDRAVETLRANGCGELVVLQCTSEYPCPPSESGLNVLAEMKRRYACDVGYSDHTEGAATAIAAVVLGAVIVEKHFTLSRRMYGSDARTSTEPDAFRQMVAAIRAVEQAMAGVVDKDIKAASLTEMKATFEKSIVAASALPRGTLLAKEHLAYKKPGTGISAASYRELLGKKLGRDVPANHPFAGDEFETD
jgi:N,N'-diacetyllegionaminate synthase